MAVRVEIANAGGNGRGDNQLPAYLAEGVRAESIATPGTGLLIAKASQWARITPDADVYVGANTVTAATGFSVLAGTTFDLSLRAGDVVAVIAQ